MKKQEYIIENDTFELKDIFDCGQCMRWNEVDDGSYKRVLKNCVLKVKKEDKKIVINGVGDGDIKKIVNYYFDLDRDYEAIKNKLSKVDNNMNIAIEYGKGIRILNQDLW